MGAFLGCLVGRRKLKRNETRVEGAWSQRSKPAYFNTRLLPSSFAFNFNLCPYMPVFSFALVWDGISPMVGLVAGAYAPPPLGSA